jgi:monoterpene epsilon-lactone hydrolase
LPTVRARMFRIALKHSIGRRFRRAGLSIPELRKLEDLMARGQRPPKGTTISQVMVNGLPAEWVLGPGAGTDAVILYLHGGAFVMCSPSTHRELAARISAVGGASVLSLAFRLSPEFPYPAAVDDTRTAYRWLLESGYAPRQVVIGGDSSGGGLALQVLLSLNEEGTPLPYAAFFMSPVTDWVGPGGESSLARPSMDPLVGLEQSRYTASLYAGTHADDPLLRPTEMNLAGLPPLWIQAGEYEILLSDAERLASRAATDGVDVDFKVWPGMWHVFQTAARFVPESRESLEELGDFLRRRLRAPETPGRSS